MVKLFDTHIAKSAMDRSARTENHASKTELKFEEVRLLPLQTVKNQERFEFSAMFGGVLIVRLLWNEARIRRSSSDHEIIHCTENQKAKS